MDQIAQIFAAQFAHWKITLPEEALSSRSRGRIRKAGWHITYVFGEDAKGPYLDYYARHRMTNDRHVRIYANGDLDHLPAEEDLRLCSQDPEEDSKLEAEYIARNRKIAEMLRRKGLH